MIDAGLNRLAQDGGEIIGSNRFGLAGGAIEGAVVAFFARHRRQPQAVNLLGCHGKACKGRRAAKLAGERLSVFQERHEQVRAARVVVADVQHLSWAVVTGKLLGKSILSVVLSNPLLVMTGIPYGSATRASWGTMPAASQITARRVRCPSVRSSMTVPASVRTASTHS